MQRITELKDKLNGKKTYIVAVLTIIYAVTGAAIGKIDWNTAVGIILAALGMSGLRHGISKV